MFLSSGVFTHACNFADFGVKYNGENGAAAPEHITNGIYQQSLVINELKMADLPEINIDDCGKTYEFTVEDHPFRVEIISSTEDYIALLRTVFSFDDIAQLFKRPDFHFHFDAINGVSGAYAKPIFHDLLGAPIESLHNCIPKPVWNHHHSNNNNNNNNNNIANDMIITVLVSCLGFRRLSP